MTIVAEPHYSIDLIPTITYQLKEEKGRPPTLKELEAELTPREDMPLAVKLEYLEADDWVKSVYVNVGGVYVPGIDLTAKGRGKGGHIYRQFVEMGDARKLEILRFIRDQSFSGMYALDTVLRRRFPEQEYAIFIDMEYIDLVSKAEPQGPHWPDRHYDFGYRITSRGLRLLEILEHH